MSKKIAQHVVPKPGGGWVVRKGGTIKVTRTFINQSEAIDFARHISIKQGAELFIHGRDGMIRDKRSYGNNPNLPNIKQ